LIEVGCWAHARRYFHKALESDQPRTGLALLLIARLYRVEKEARPLTAEDRLRLRQLQSQPILEKLRNYLLEIQTEVLPKSPESELILSSGSKTLLPASPIIPSTGSPSFCRTTERLSRLDLLNTEPHGTDFDAGSSWRFSDAYELLHGIVVARRTQECRADGCALGSSQRWSHAPVTPPFGGRRAVE
jgi:Transposase IS66 family